MIILKEAKQLHMAIAQQRHPSSSSYGFVIGVIVMQLNIYTLSTICYKHLLFFTHKKKGLYAVGSRMTVAKRHPNFQQHKSLILQLTTKENSRKKPPPATVPRQAISL